MGRPASATLDSMRSPKNTPSNPRLSASTVRSSWAEKGFSPGATHTAGRNPNRGRRVTAAPPG